MIMKYFLTVLLLGSLALIGCSSYNGGNQMSTEDQQQEEWIILFDGSNTDHWRSYNSDRFPEVGWTVKDKTLVFNPIDQDGSEGGQNLITKEKFENFHLQLEWKIEDGSNSGIFYGVLEQDEVDIYWSGLEYQIIDSDIFSEINNDTEKRISGALYDLIKPDPVNTHPIGEWNRAEIIVDGATLIHRLNGETVVETERWTPKWFEMIRNSKFVNHNEFGNIRNGHIGIQDHGGPVMIRNVRVKRI